MANQITDLRTLLFDAGDGTGGAPDDLAGLATGTTDTSTFIQGSTSYTISASNSRVGMLYDAGTAQNWANNTFWIWDNSGVVGLMDTKANGGRTIRFCGNTVTDWFEVYVGGSDAWPSSIEGGWVQWVIDIEQARSVAVTNGWTNGTTPATSAIRYVGTTNLLTVMPKMADNTWIDAIWRNPTANPAFRIEGRNGGTTDWDSADIFTQLGTSAGMFIPTAGGAYKINAPFEIGLNDTTTHGFTDTNAIWLWDNQEFVVDGSYKITVTGGASGTTNVTLGSKTGTGDAATGSQGLTIAADPTGARWDIDANDANIDLFALYGCSLQHGGDFLLDDPAVSCISTLYIDCTSALVSNSEQLRVSVIAANTADGVAFMTTDDVSDIVFSSFQFSDGHAIEMTTTLVASQTSKGNLFTGYSGTPGSNLVANSGSTDAAIYNNAGGAVTLAITDGGDTPSIRNGASATTAVTNNVTLELSNVVVGSTVAIVAESGGPETVGDYLLSKVAVPSSFGYVTTDATGEKLRTTTNVDTSSTSTESFEIFALVYKADWDDSASSQYIVAVQNSIVFAIGTSGNAFLQVTDGAGSTNVTSTTGSTLVDAEWWWFRARWSNTGASTFYLSQASEQLHPEDIDDWTTTGTPSGTGRNPQNSSQAAHVASITSSGTPLGGRVAYAAIWTGGYAATTGVKAFEWDGRTGPAFVSNERPGDVPVDATMELVGGATYTTATTTPLTLTETYNYTSSQPVVVRARRSQDGDQKYQPFEQYTSIGSGGLSLPINQIVDVIADDQP